MSSSPTDMIRKSPMSLYQYAIIALCVLTYASDGVDVVTLSYAAPVLMKEWGISPATFGLAYTATPIGIALGSFFLSPLADRIGRRTLTLWLLGSLVIMLFATAFSSSLLMLVTLRLLTGISLGALVVCLNVTVSEFSNEERSNVLIGILHTGYSAGGMICGALAALLLEPLGWRSLFLAAGALSVVSFVLSLFVLAESPMYLIARRPANALQRLNAIFRRMNKPEFDSLPPAPEAKAGKGRAIIPRTLLFGTAMLCLAGFVFTVSGGFMASWRPKLLDMAHMTMTWNGIAGVSTHGAGIFAHLFVGALARKVGERKIAVIFLLGMGFAFTLLGAVPDGALLPLVIASTLSGFFNVGAFTAIILVTLNYFEPGVRSAGLGIMLGCSRVGGIVGPLVGGFVIAAGFGRFWTLFLFAAILIIPVVAAIYARARPGDAAVAAHG
ncbi:MAG: MFS transporter [Pseudomonadota bacterium]